MAVTSTHSPSSTLTNGKTINMENHREFFALDGSSVEDQTALRRRAPVAAKEKVKPKVGPKKLVKAKWQMRDILHLGMAVSIHLLCLFAPSTFSWKALGVTYFLYILTGAFGITLSYHRNLAHKSFKIPKYLEYLFAYFGLLAFTGDPIFWVSTHRYHHKYTDKPQDPHSPREGFWFSHILWIFDVERFVQKDIISTKNVGDLIRQPYYRFLRKTMILHVYLLAILLYTLGGFPFIVWGIGVRTVWNLHITLAVNSVCHTWGVQAWKTGDLSRNNWIVGILAFGEGWHNNHHAFEYSARHGLEWWQFDLTWCMIKLLEYVGLATDVKLPTEQHMKKMASRNGVEGKKLQYDDDGKKLSYDDQVKNSAIIM